MKESSFSKTKLCDLMWTAMRKRGLLWSCNHRWRMKGKQDEEDGNEERCWRKWQTAWFFPWIDFSTCRIYLPAARWHLLKHTYTHLLSARPSRTTLSGLFKAGPLNTLASRDGDLVTVPNGLRDLKSNFMSCAVLEHSKEKVTYKCTDAMPVLPYNLWKKHAISNNPFEC